MGEGLDAENSKRYGVTRSRLLPENRKKFLNRKILQRLEIDAARIKENGGICFYQLLIPMFSVIKLGISKDPRKITILK